MRVCEDLNLSPQTCTISTYQLSYLLSPPCYFFLNSILSYSAVWWASSWHFLFINHCVLPTFAPHYPLLLILFLLLLMGPLVPSQYLRWNLVSAYERKHELSCLSCLSLPFAPTFPCLWLPFLPYCAHLLPCPIHGICLSIGYIQGCICSLLDSTQERKHAGVGHPGSANSIHLPEDDVISFFLTAK